MASFNSSNPPASGDDKRRYARYSRNFRIDLLDAKSRPADEAIHLVDMSGSGVGIICRQPFSVGQALGFKMSLDGGRPVQATARVRWSRPSGFRQAYGLEIEGLGFFARRRLVKQLEPATGASLEDFLTLALQAAATLTAVWVLGDWIRSNPHITPAMMMCLPYFVVVSIAAFLAWAIPRIY